MRSLFRKMRRRRDGEIARIDAEITAFGEALARCPLPEGRDDPGLLDDYARALDAYEQAKRDLVGDRDREDAEDVLRALDEGRHALACVRARLDGQPVPERRPLCFFDPRHGPSTGRVRWAPPEGASRPIDVCAADAARLADGLPPIAPARSARPRPVARPRPARGAEPVRQRRPAAPGEPRPFKGWPRDLPKESRISGRHTAKRYVRRELARPEHGVPLVLVVRFHGAGPARVTLGSGLELFRGKAPAYVVHPMRADVADPVAFEVMAPDTWSAWLQVTDDLPVLTGQISGQSGYLFRHTGGAAAIAMEHRNQGAFAITAVTSECEFGEPVLEGDGYTVAFGRLPGPGLFHLRARGDWTITLT